MKVCVGCQPVQTLLSQHGVVCVSRVGSDTARLLDRPGSLLHTYRRNVVLVDEPLLNEISSSKVSSWFAEGNGPRFVH